MPGTNGILNAMEYYKFPENVSPFVLVWEDNGFSYKHEYWGNWPKVIKNEINQDKWGLEKDTYWHMVFLDKDFALKHLFDEFDVILFWGADVCPLNDFSEYFDICHKLDRIVIGHNEQGVQNYNAMSKEKPYGHTWDVPYADIPLFIPKSHREVLSVTFELQDGKNKVDWMDGLNYAIRDLKMNPFVVPGMLWVFNITGLCKIWNDNGQRYYVWNQRMNSFHRKYWTSAFCKSYIPDMGEVSGHNHFMFNRIWNFFNRNCRVKWEEGIDFWDGK